MKHPSDMDVSETSWIKPTREAYIVECCILLVDDRLNKVEMLLIGGDLNGHVGSECDMHQGVQWGRGCLWNKN